MECKLWTSADDLLHFQPSQPSRSSLFSLGLMQHYFTIQVHTEHMYGCGRPQSVQPVPG